MGNDQYLVCVSCKKKIHIAHNFTTIEEEDIPFLINSLKMCNHFFPQNSFIYRLKDLEEFYEKHKDRKFHYLRIIDPINDDIKQWNDYDKAD